MLFKLTNDKMKRETHCGVLEFVADEGRIYIPYWVGRIPRSTLQSTLFFFFHLLLQMMTNLLLEEGSLVQLENVSLPVATFAKFEPQSMDFLDISNPKAVYPCTLILTYINILNPFRTYFLDCSLVWKITFAILLV
jgi:ubiquitin fusion degradation protein 1